jgi:hypothetical protein
MYLDTHVDEKENWPELAALTSIFSVELPGIEPAREIALSCGNIGFGSRNDAKRRGGLSYAKGVDGINTPGSLRVPQ